MTVVRVIPDLDDDLIAAISGVEELLLTLSVWEDDPDDPAQLPAPLAGRVALDALQRLWEAIEPTQTRTGRPTLTGRLLGPDGRYEHLPLRLLVVDQGDLDIIGAAAAALGHAVATTNTNPDTDLGGSELADAIAAGAEAAAPLHGPAPTPAQLVESFARIHGLLDLADTDDTQQLRALLADVAAGHDIVFTTDQEQAYQRLADRFNTMWTSGSPTSRFLY